MKLKLWIAIFFIAISSQLFAQEKSTEQKKWIMKWNTTAAVDVFSFPTIQFAVEKKLNDNFSIQTEIGYQFYEFSKPETSIVKTSGFRLIAEGRFYVFNYFKNDKTKKRKSDGLYTGIQIFYRKNNYNYNQEYYTNQSDYENHINLLSDTFGVKKEVYGTNICLGYQIPFNNFILEPYVYIGVLKRNIENLEREYNPNIGHVSADDIHYRGKDLEEESRNDGNFSFGLRLGYKF